MIRAAMPQVATDIDRPFYAVVHIQSGKVWYQGQNIDSAAVWLEPGTCFSEGITKEAAVQSALE